MKPAVLLGAIRANRVVPEGPVALRLAAQLENLAHEVRVIRAGEEDWSLPPHREAGQDSEDVVVPIANVLVAPQLPGDTVHDDEPLLVGSGQFVGLVEELSRSERGQEVTGLFVFDADEILVSIVANLNQTDVDLPIGELLGSVQLERIVPFFLFTCVNCKDWHTRAAS